MDYRLLADSAVLAGEILLRNGAETYIVEDTINQILRTEKMKHIESVVLVTMIVATISNPDMDPITVIRRIERPKSAFKNRFGQPKFPIWAMLHFISIKIRNPQ